MSFAGLGAFAGGAAQGIDQGAQIRQRAVQIQQAQMALDQEKHKIAGMAAAFSNLGGAPGGQGGQPPTQPPPQQTGPQAQPMPPGQPSVPSQPQGGGGQPPMGLPANGAPPPPGGPQQQPQGPPAPQPPVGQPQQGGQDTMSAIMDPQAPVKALMSIAKEIKVRNPNISPTDLAYATQQIVEQSKGLDPAMRQSMMLLATQIRAQTSTQNTERQVEGRQSVADTGAASREGIAANRDATQRRGQDMTLQGRMQTAGAAMDRAKMIQSAMDKRFSTGQGNQAQKTAMTERLRAATAQLTTAQRQLSSLQGSLVAADDARVVKAGKDVDEATAKLDMLAKRLEMPEAGESAGGAGPAGAPAPGGGDQPLTATDAKGNKVHYLNGQWVPVGK